MSRRGENIYKRKDGRWEGRILKPDGHYQYVYGKNYREVKEKKTSLAGVKNSPEDIRNLSHSATVLFDSWLVNCAAERVKCSTYDSYYYCVQKYILPFFRRNGPDRLTKAQITRFAQSVYEDGCISSSYKRKILSIFKTALSDIVKKYGIDRSVLNAIQLPRADYSALKVFSIREQCRIEWEVRKEENKKAYSILVCIYTGIRLGELCALKWGNVDLDSRTMTITATVGRTKNPDKINGKTRLSVGPPKSRSSVRKIPIPDFLFDLLKGIGMDEKNNDHYIITDSDKPADPRAIQKLYKKVLRNAGVPDRKFHTLRHTFATRALEMGVDIKTLSEILGHSNVAVTLNIYAHSMLEQKKIAIDKMNAMYVTHAALPLSAVGNTVMQACIPK